MCGSAQGARAAARAVAGAGGARACWGWLLKVLPVFDQDNWRLIALILPISLGFAGAFDLDRLLARGAPGGREPQRQRRSFYS